MHAVIEVSIVVPAFNEAPLLEKTISSLVEIVNSAAKTYEIIVVNDGSTDETAAILLSISQRISHIRIIELARNYGKEAALEAGLEASAGSSVIFIDADLQHPPELIPRMLELWRQGFEIVNARRQDRKDQSLFYQVAAGAFNALMSHAIGENFFGSTDFKLIDRKVVEAIKKCPERNRFFRGLVTWVGFQSTDIDFVAPLRPIGSTKWDLLGLIQYALKSLMAFSSLPLRIIAYTGFITTGIGFILLLQTFVNYYSGTAAIGFTTVIALQILLSGMILLGLGVIALFLASIYDEQKARPLFVVRKTTGFDAQSNQKNKSDP